MICDFNELENQATLATDVCVIGSGAAGITIALEFIGTAFNVVLLAGGGQRHEPESQRLYESDLVGLFHQSIHDGRARVHGGTTTLWAGQALPLDEIDFKPRDWVAHSGWPFTRELLEPFYRRAECVMRVPTHTYDERSWPPPARRPPAYDPAKLRPRISDFSPTPDFRLAYRAELAAAPNVRVLLNAHATSIVTNESASAVDHVELKSLAGNSGTCQARFTIVCCGGIETARLLLASNRALPQGVGNRNDLVGRFFQDHVHAKTAVLRPRNRKTTQALFDPFYFQGIKFAPKICSSFELQKEKRILNVAGDTCYDIPEDSAVEALKLILRAPRRRDQWGRLPRAFWQVARRPHEVVSAAYQYLVRKQTISYNRGTMYLGAQCEQQPNPQSRVSLGDRVDALGMPRAVLDWRLTTLEQQSIEVFVRTVAEEFDRLGIGTVDLSTFTLPEQPDQLDRLVHDASHHMGTARMHDDPRYGVVDRDCRVHGVNNLFIGSSAVFPTGGFSNPTLTIIALCLRMSDLLKDLLRSGAALVNSGSGARAGDP
ncbi:MAG TPA: GMC family oxidoreductase [Isosphaeraceae bacterium]|nr:GMC family oxidoreductase [Isosphaeraceae bacterium]